MWRGEFWGEFGKKLKKLRKKLKKLGDREPRSGDLLVVNLYIVIRYRKLSYSENSDLNPNK
jgi:hypothetical protein